MKVAHGKSRSVRERVAANLRRAREQAALSQDELAAKAGFHRTYIGTVERCETNITIDNLQRLAEALGLDAVDLIGRP